MFSQLLPAVVGNDAARLRIERRTPGQPVPSERHIFGLQRSIRDADRLLDNLGADTVAADDRDPRSAIAESLQNVLKNAAPLCRYFFIGDTPL